MIKLTITSIALCIGFTAIKAQEIKEADVPVIVKDAFAKKYPGSKANEWEKEGAHYEVEFDLNKIESTAIFTVDGTFKELEQEIKLTELPKVAVDYCTNNYVGYKLAEAEKITDAEGKVMYEAEMEKGKEHFDVMFDDKGNFVNKGEIEKESDSEKKD